MIARAIHAPLGPKLQRSMPRVWPSTRVDRTHAAPAREGVSALRFEGPGGPLLVLAGVCGGAGTTMLSYLVAVASARASRAPVLLADLGGPGAAVSAYTRVESTHSVPRLADHVAHGRRLPRQPFETASDGLRVLASRPEFDGPVPDSAAREVLLQARAAHALTVVDCGSLVRPVEGVALSAASHLGWVVPATPLGVRRAALLFGAVHRNGAVRELIIARSEPGVSRQVVSDLADLADLRSAPLVLVPRLGDPIDRDVAGVIGEAAASLQAIGCVLRR
jgi:Flp pilus assembly CpaE family ATPase